MRKRSTQHMLMAGVMGLAILAAPFTARAEEDLWGAPAARSDANLTLEEMLTYALQDEYLAHAEYGMILSDYGQVRPFSNIVNAEARHIGLLVPLFESRALVVPPDEARERIVLPATLEESFQDGVEAEILNIEMYQRFLKEDLPEDVEAVFQRLMTASESHLQAFERAVARDGAVPPEGSGRKALTEGRAEPGPPREISGQSLKTIHGVPREEAPAGTVSGKQPQ